MTRERLGRFLPAVFLSVITLIILSGCCSSKEQSESGKDLPPAEPVEVGTAIVNATLDGTTETGEGVATAFTITEVHAVGAAAPPVSPGDLVNLLIPSAVVDANKLTIGEVYTMKLRSAKPAMGENGARWTFVQFQ